MWSLSLILELLSPRLCSGINYSGCKHPWAGLNRAPAIPVSSPCLTKSLCHFHLKRHLPSVPAHPHFAYKKRQSCFEAFIFNALFFHLSVTMEDDWRAETQRLFNFPNWFNLMKKECYILLNYIMIKRSW